jgi:hypothetical protein
MLSRSGRRAERRVSARYRPALRLPAVTTLGSEGSPGESSRMAWMGAAGTGQPEVQAPADRISRLRVARHVTRNCWLWRVL